MKVHSECERKYFIYIYLASLENVIIIFHQPQIVISCDLA